MVASADDAPTPTSASDNQTDDQFSNATFLEPIAEPLVRYRRHPPRTIVKHIIRPKRVKVKRVKRPKIKYSFAEPPPTIYYRKVKPAPTYSHAPPTYDSSLFEDFSHYNVESSDFDLPPSSYETHSMDLDFYKSYESAAEAVYKESEKPSYTYNVPEIPFEEPAKEIEKPSYTYSVPEIPFKEPVKEVEKPSYTYSVPEIPFKEPAKEIEKPSYTYKVPEIPFKEHPKIPAYTYSAPKKQRKPHTQYGIPTDYTYSTGYDKPSGNSYSYEEEHYEKSPGNGYSYQAPSATALDDHHPIKQAEHPPTSYSGEGSYEKGHNNGYIYQAPSYEEQPNKLSEHPSSYAGGGHESGYESGHEGGQGSSHESQHEAGHASGGYSYQPPAHDPSPTYTQPGKEDYSYSPPHPPPEKTPRIPATKYGVPDFHLPPPKFEDYNKYTVVNQKVPEPPYKNKHHFAEPPDPHKPSVHITYSPSYEINVPPPSDGHYNRGYESPPPQQYDHHPPANYHPDSSGHQESSDSHQPAKYEPAPIQDLPIDQNHKHPTYDYPKSSYEVPIYDPIPFDSSTNQEREIYPPQPFDNNSWQEASQTEYTAEPNNVSERKPADNMESSQHPESDEMPQEDAHSSGTRTQSQTTVAASQQRPQRNRKRKRPKDATSTTLAATTKHILDVPELQEAFEKEKRNSQHNTDADINESHKVVKINSGPWNPMRIRTPALTPTRTPTTLAINQYQNQDAGRNSYRQRTRSTTTTTESSRAPTPPPGAHQKPQHQTNQIPNIEIVSIEKSRSKTYYDGILSTPKIYNTNFYRNRYKTSSHQQPQTPTATTATSTIAPHLTGASSSSVAATSANMERFSKRTTKNIFDTTIFKSPLNDRGDVYRNLPKNHKLF